MDREPSRTPPLGPAACRPIDQPAINKGRAGLGVTPLQTKASGNHTGRRLLQQFPPAARGQENARAVPTSYRQGHAIVRMRQQPPEGVPCDLHAFTGALCADGDGPLHRKDFCGSVSIFSLDTDAQHPPSAKTMLDMLPSLTSIVMSGDVTICLMKACKPGHLDKLPGLLSCKAAVAWAGPKRPMLIFPRGDPALRVLAVACRAASTQVLSALKADYPDYPSLKECVVALLFPEDAHTPRKCPALTPNERRTPSPAPAPSPGPDLARLSLHSPHQQHQDSYIPVPSYSIVSSTPLGGGPARDPGEPGTSPLAAQVAYSAHVPPPPPPPLPPPRLQLKQQHQHQHQQQLQHQQHPHQQQANPATPWQLPQPAAGQLSIYAHKLGHVQLTFDMQHPLGQGTFGVVYHAQMTLMDGSHVNAAAKMLRATDARAVEDLHREGAVLQSLDHPNIVRLFVMELNPPRPYQPFLLMERCHGTLQTIIDESQATGHMWTARFVWQVASEVAAGVLVLHQHSIIHRDLKPLNVLYVTKDDRKRFKVADCGLARPAYAPDHGQATLRVGTYDFMAPELWNEQRERKCGPVSAKVDVYSFGVLLERLAERCAFRHRLEFEDLIKACKAERSSRRLDSSELAQRLDAMKPHLEKLPAY